VAGSTYKGSYTGIGEMLRSDFLEAEMGRRAQRVADLAVASAPVYGGPDEDPHRGRYKESFSVSTTGRGGWKKDRAAGIVTNDAPEAVFVEYGVRATKYHPSGQPGHHTLLNALYAGAGD
jgi:hypothetical protein